jgi:hypothetical protein
MGNLAKIAEFFFMGFFFVAGLAVIFVKAGSQGGQSGGEQTSEIFEGAGSGLNSVASGLEG